MSYESSWAEETADLDYESGVVLLEFGAKWCRHCKAIQEYLESFLEERPEITHYKIGDGKGKPLGRKFNVKLWPNFVLLRDGEVLGQMTRPTPEDLDSLLDLSVSGSGETESTVEVSRDDSAFASGKSEATATPDGAEPPEGPSPDSADGGVESSAAESTDDDGVAEPKSSAESDNGSTESESATKSSDDTAEPESAKSSDAEDADPASAAKSSDAEAAGSTARSSDAEDADPSSTANPSDAEDAGSTGDQPSDGGPDNSAADSPQDGPEGSGSTAPPSGDGAAVHESAADEAVPEGAAAHDEGADPSTSPTTSHSSLPIVAGELNEDTVLACCQRLSSKLNRADLLEALFALLRTHWGATSGMFSLEDPPMEARIQADETILIVEGQFQESTSLPHAVTRAVRESKETILIGDVKEQTRFNPESDLSPANPLSVLSVPLFQGDFLVGLLYLENDQKTDAFSQEQIPHLNKLLSQLAISLENAGRYLKLDEALRQARQELKRARVHISELQAEAQRLSGLDELTGIHSRQRFESTLGDEWRRAFRSQNPLSLILFDLDYFGAFTEGYGVEAGDRCLQQVAGCLSSSLARAGDLAARYSHHTLCIILPNTDVDGAVLVAERIQKKILDLRIEHDYSEVANIVTVSIGVGSTFPDPDISPEVLIVQAEEGAKRAWETGRNLIYAPA